MLSLGIKLKFRGHTPLKLPGSDLVVSIKTYQKVLTSPENFRFSRREKRAPREVFQVIKEKMQTFLSR